MKKNFLLIFFLLVGISFNVKAENAKEIYDKLLQNCNKLKSENLIHSDCNKLNNRDLKKNNRKRFI